MTRNLAGNVTKQMQFADGGKRHVIIGGLAWLGRQQLFADSRQ
jgi:hypothetical protein